MGIDPVRVITNQAIAKLKGLGVDQIRSTEAHLDAFSSIADGDEGRGIEGTSTRQDFVDAHGHAGGLR